MVYHVSQGKALFSGFDQCPVLQDIVLKARPAKPLYVFFPNIIERNAKAFLDIFPGKPLYAVKTNPDGSVLRVLGRAGIKAFDVASLAEIQLVKSLFPRSELHFMHPVKMPEDIRAAYFDYGVRHFVLDHEEELFKIMRETELAQDLSLTVRVAMPKNEKALIDFSSKFGASFTQAMDLLQKCRPVSQMLGMSFHVGTQTTDARAYARAISYCARILEASDVEIDTLNVGGGFPVLYDGDVNICDVADCVHAIQSTLEKHKLTHIGLIAEPGRVLVADGAKLVTRVELRKDDILYINDGVYGGLFDAAKWVGTRYPVSAISCDRPFDGKTRAFKLAGPTCDSLDMMEGPFMLPHDIGIGDWVVFDKAGAYSQALRSDFNGFGHADIISCPEKAV